ncbi:hypothetical protein [Hymenobacter psychrotolerans]|uniref:hypothetical protein n=1 Tax=Hymenobacter psychrotolerans TaxID=344998 RepID=UPI001114A425|nr:hypothetical protein [Hymenobacter psychrotolerans]
MDVEQRNLWRARWLDSIAELTNLDLQLNMWLDESNTNPHWGYVEFMCCYFDDLILTKGYQRFLEDTWVSVAEYDCLKDWHELLDNYAPPSNDNYDNRAILNDAEWRRIVALGLAAKEQLINLLPPTEAYRLRN